MKKVLATLLVGALSVGLLVGCGNSGGGGSGSGGSSAAPEGSASAAEEASAPAETPEEGGEDAATGDPITICQIVTSLTGGASLYGEYIVNSAQMAADEINAAGGINGRPIEIVYMDDQADSTVAMQCMQKFIDEYDCAAVLGPDWSGNTMATLPVSSEAGMPQLTTSKARKITHQEGVDNVFRMVAPGNFVGEALVQVAVEKGYKNIAIICSNTEYGLGGGEGAKVACEAAGLNVVDYQTFNSGDVDFTAQWTSIINSKPDAIIEYAEQVEAAKSYVQLREMGSEIPMLGGDSFITPAFAELVGYEYMENTTAASAFVSCVPTDACQQYVEKYKELFGKDPDDHGSAYYDAVYILAKVIGEKGTDHAAIIEGLKGLTDYQGCQGTYTGDQWGNLIHTLNVVEFHDGNWTYLFTTDPVSDHDGE